MTLIMPKTLWDEIVIEVEKRLRTGILKKPIVFALDTTEVDHYLVIGYREISTVCVKGDYPNGKYDYSYPGIKNLGFYHPKGKGRWFSGTLVVGDGVCLDDSDKMWMLKEELYFRIKMIKDNDGRLRWKTYCLDFPEVPINFIN